MHTWELGVERRPSAPPAAPPASYADAFVAAIVDAIGEPNFGQLTLTQLNQLAAVDFWSVYRLDQAAPPQMFLSGSRKGADVSDDCFRSYCAGLYRDDRTFAGAFRVAGGSGAAMTLWNEAEIPSPHRDRIYRRHGIRERLSVVGGDGDSGLLAVNLYRYDAAGNYRSSEIDQVEALGRGLLASVRKHIRLQGQMRHAVLADNGAARLRAHCPALTQRELDVCERLLRGWTYDGIAADLGLSTPSVKTYRARAFDRLGIHFRNELFALVMQQ